MVIDYRRLNDNTVDDVYNDTNFEEGLFTHIDYYKSFRESRNKYAFYVKELLLIL